MYRSKHSNNLLQASYTMFIKKEWKKNCHSQENI